MNPALELRSGWGGSLRRRVIIPSIPQVLQVRAVCRFSWPQRHARCRAVRSRPAARLRGGASVTEVYDVRSLEPRLNRTFAEYAQDRGCLADPARIRRPTDPHRSPVVVPGPPVNPKDPPHPSSPWSVVTLASSESTARRPFGPQAEVSDLLPGLNGIRSGNVSMLVMIIGGSNPEWFRASPGNGSLVPRVVFRV